MSEALPQPAGQEQAQAARRRANLLVVLVAVAMVLVPFLFWKATWFGRPLSNEELGEYLTDRDTPRHAQHALVQMSERIERGDTTVQQWYPEAVALKDSPITELRVTLAWMLGSDNHSELFHRTLLTLLNDPAPLVRRNAALELVRFGDASGRNEILAILQPAPVVSPASGVLSYNTKVGASVEVNARLGAVETSDGRAVDVQTPLPGTVLSLRATEGARVQTGQQIILLSPAEDHVFEALRALYLIGEQQDLAAVEAFKAPQYSARIQQQADLTADEIQRRAKAQSEPRP